jgi:membrane protease YdiL (CAAX protease family)
MAMEHQQSKEPAKAIAPAWHTAALVGLILAVALGGSLLGRDIELERFTSGTSRVGLYASMIAVNLALAAYVCRFDWTGNAFVSLIGKRWRSLGRALGDIGLAIIAVASVSGLEAAWQSSFGSSRVESVIEMLPVTPLERVVWCGVAFSVALGEELVYRGYLLTQLTRFTRLTAAGVFLQAALFAIAHADQGAAVMFRFLAYGIGLGALALWRSSLIPGMLCHAVLDLAAGFGR